MRSLFGILGTISVEPKVPSYKQSNVQTEIAVKLPSYMFGLYFCGQEVNNQSERDTCTLSLLQRHFLEIVYYNPG